MLRAQIRLALTGTPVENRLGDLWSLFDFLCPGLLGSAKAFGRFVQLGGEALPTRLRARCASWSAPTSSGA